MTPLPLPLVVVQVIVVSFILSLASRQPAAFVSVHQSPPESAGFSVFRCSPDDISPPPPPCNRRTYG